MTELEIFSKSIIEEGGEFYTLETSIHGKLAKTVSHYSVKHHVYNEVIYQVFNKAGKRVFASVDYFTALTYYENMMKGVK